MQTLGLILLVTCASLPSVIFAEARGIDVAVSIEQNKTDFNYSGSNRETRLTNLEVAWVEKLAPSIYGGIELGYLEMTQYNNPLAVGQTGSGRYLGLSLSFNLLETSQLQLLTEVGYRYSEASHAIDAQTIDWDWHQGRISLLGKWQISQRLTVLLGSTATAIDGRERAEGTVNLAQPFKTNKPISGHLGLQFGLDPAGTIGIQIDAGSQRGGRISIRRAF